MPDLTDLPFFCSTFPTFFVDKIEKKMIEGITDNRKTQFIPPPEIKCPLTCFELANINNLR